MIGARVRRRIAGINTWVWAALALPGSWLIPTLDEIWFQRLALFLCFVGLVLPAADGWQTENAQVEAD